jgi:hypothetical protein
MWDDGHTSLRVLFQLLAEEPGARLIACERLQAKHSPGRRFRSNDLRCEALQLFRETFL